MAQKYRGRTENGSGINWPPGSRSGKNIYRSTSLI